MKVIFAAGLIYFVPQENITVKLARVSGGNNIDWNEWYSVMSISCKNIQEDKQVPVSTITIYLWKLETK